MTAYIAGLKTLCILVDESIDAFADIRFKMGIKGTRRTMRHCPRKAAALTPRILMAMKAHLRPEVSRDLVSWSAITLGFACMARKSNLVPESSGKFDPDCQLCRSNIEIAADKSCLTITLTWSKTNQDMDRELVIPVLALPGSPICPVAAYCAAVSAVPARGNGVCPAFAIPAPKGAIDKKPVALSYAMLTADLKRLLKLAGFDESLFSSHSIRRHHA